MANDWGAPAFNEAPADAWGGDAKGTSATNGDGGFAATNGDGFGAASAGDVALAVEDAAAKQKREEYEKKARDAGWTEKTAFDYDEFLRSGGNHSSLTISPFENSKLTSSCRRQWGLERFHCQVRVEGRVR